MILGTIIKILCLDACLDAFFSKLDKNLNPIFNKIKPGDFYSRITCRVNLEEFTMYKCKIISVSDKYIDFLCDRSIIYSITYGTVAEPFIKGKSIYTKLEFGPDLQNVNFIK